jgi:hypothetical protein
MTHSLADNAKPKRPTTDLAFKRTNDGATATSLAPSRAYGRG